MYELGIGVVRIKWGQGIKYLTINYCWAFFFSFVGSLSQDFLLGFRSVLLAPWGIWQTWSWNESSTLKGAVRAHRQSHSQQPIFQPSSWPICNPLVCFVAVGSSWPLFHFPAFLGRTVAVLLRSEAHKTQRSCPQTTCGISPRTFHVLPIGVTNTWDHRGKRAGQNKCKPLGVATGSGTDCESVCSDQIFYRKKYSCLLEMRFSVFPSALVHIAHNSRMFLS